MLTVVPSLPPKDGGSSPSVIRSPKSCAEIAARLRAVQLSNGPVGEARNSQSAPSTSPSTSETTSLGAFARYLIPNTRGCATTSIAISATTGKSQAPGRSSPPLGRCWLGGVRVTPD
jgi:hypothetical protein